MSNPIQTGFKAFEDYMANLAKAAWGQTKVTIAKFLHDYAKEELGQLAVKAAEFAEQSTGLTGPQKLDLAKQKLVELATAAGKDATTLGTSDLNFLVEAAVQKIQGDAGKGLLALAA